MAAGLGFKTFTTGEVLTAADTNGYLMQGILVFASAAARAIAITSPQEGQYSYLKDTNALEYYDGAAWVGAPVGDITAVTAGKGLTGGGSSGDVTVSLATTAKGDLVAGSGASTAAVLTVGNNGETLVADSSTSTGLRWTGGVPIANPLINSCMDIWQRGTSFTATSGYVADRWYYAQFAGGGGITITRQATGDTTNLPNVQYSMRVQRNSGSTVTNAPQWAQSIETINAIPFAGKTVTFSFYARCGANYSATSSLLNLNLITGTGTDQNVLSTGFTGQSIPINTSATLTTTWQRFTYTATLAATATEIAAYFNFSPTGTAGANDWVEITGVQIDIGSVALPVRRNGATIQGELAACKRYLPSYDNTLGTNNGFVSGYAYGTNTSIFMVPFDVPARVNPTGMTVSGTINAYALNTSTGITPTFDAAGINSAAILASHTITAGQGARLGITSGAKLLFTGCEL